MLYKGAKPAALYRGAYKPGKLCKGTQLVAGYEDVAKAAPASWDGTYDDVVGVAAQGRGKQQTYSGKNLLDDAAMRNYSNWLDDIPGTTGVNMGYVITEAPGTYTLSWTQPDDGSFPSFFYIYVVDENVEGPYCLTMNRVINLSCTIDVPAGGYAYVRLTGIGSESAFREEITKIATIQLETGSTATAYEPYVGGKPSPSPDYPQPLVAAEGTLTASGRAGTTPTTVTLPVLRAIPGTDIRDELAYIGNGQWQVTRRVGEIVVDGETAKWELSLDKAFWNLTQKAPGVGQDMRGKNNLGLQISSSQRHELLFSTPKWGAAIGIDSVDALNALCQTTPMTICYALATPTTETVTLGELPSYPVHTALAVSGDYPPDVTGTVKVSL